MHHEKEVKKVGRWYDGGVASAVAIFCTQPIDLLKVQLQTQPEEDRKNICQLLIAVLKERGCCGLYSGVVSAMLRQLTYSTTRFAIYESLKERFEIRTIGPTALATSVAGIVGAYVGNPFDVVTVRMQADSKLPPEERRNYKTVIHGFIHIVREEGFLMLFAGVTTATLRSILMSMGQLGVYDQVKSLLLDTSIFIDNAVVHWTASIICGVITTFMTQPMDVVKTRMMHAEQGTYDGIWDCMKKTAKEGFYAFYKGIVPSLIRVTPNIILIHIMREQLRIHLGKEVKQES